MDGWAKDNFPWHDRRSDIGVKCNNYYFLLLSTKPLLVVKINIPSKADS